MNTNVINVTAENLKKYYEKRNIKIAGLNEESLKDENSIIKIFPEIFIADNLNIEMSVKTLLNNYFGNIFEFKEYWDIDITMISDYLKESIIKNYFETNKENPEYFEYNGVHFNGVAISDYNKVIMFKTEYK